MAIIKCKMCGGDIQLAEDKTFGTCEYCGCTMTFPKVSDEQRAAAFNRGNYFRRIGEFDKALAVYERIVAEDEADAEAHWCCALCRFGIEYVEDPATFEWLPTCHRASFDSFLEDVDYLAALEHSDGITKRQYQKDAAKIAEVQRGILATSQNTEPYDVFISYKELDADGSRTRDSILAQEVYYRLTERGWRVFFSRISLEDVPGTQYEPYIFAALNSAKVMIVVGTSAENLNAVWVKNEWSRYLSLMRKDRSKLLIPCYRDMDPYDLPEQLSVLMSYDMGRIGFVQDLIRGVDKVLGTEKPKETKKETVVVQQSGGVNIAPMLERAFMFLEDGDWKSADEYCEKVLDLDPKNAQAYLGKLMAELRVMKREQLVYQDRPFDSSDNFKKILRFGDQSLTASLKDDIAQINERNEEKTEAVIAALCEKKREKALATTKQALREAQNKKDRINQILSVYDDTCEKAEMAENEYRAIAKRIDTLEKEKSKLGLFAGKEKKRIDGEIAAATASLAEKRTAAEKLRAALGGYTTKQQAENDASAAEKQIAEAENKIRKLSEASRTQLSYEQAVSILKTDAAVRNAAETIRPGICLVIAEKGSTVTFGKYPQSQNGKDETPIEWVVLANETDRLLVISRYALDCLQYNSERTDITWEKCSLRKWLNETFINTAFSSEEKAMIPTVTVSADKNPSYDTSPGNNTKDQVFLLSIPEVEKYFSSDEARKCVLTEYAIAQGAWTDDENQVDGKPTCWWWLRSPGNYSDRAANVDFVGSVYHGDFVSGGDSAVRPALWIDIGL